MIYTGQTFYGSEVTLGDEIVINGAMTGILTDWTLGTGWTDGINDVDKSIDGTGTLAPAVPLTPVAAQWYKVGFTVSGYSVGNFTVSFGGTTFPSTYLNNGVYSTFIKTTNTNSLIFTPTNTSRFSLDDVTVKPLISGDPSGYSDIEVPTTLSAFANVKERNLVVDDILVTLLTKN